MGAWVCPTAGDNVLDRDVVKFYLNITLDFLNLFSWEYLRDMLKKYLCFKLVKYFARLYFGTAGQPTVHPFHTE